MRDLQALRESVRQLGENVTRLRVRRGGLSDREQVIAVHRKIMNKRDLSDRALEMALYTTFVLSETYPGAPLTEVLLDEAENYVDHATPEEREKFDEQARISLEEFCCQQGIENPYESILKLSVYD